MNRNKMKILIISTTKFELDGITNVILNYYRAIDKSNMNIDFVIPNDIREDLKIELNASNSRIFKLDGRMKKPFKYIKKLTLLIKKNEYDIVHAHGNSCTLALEMFAAKQGGSKVRISHSHNSSNKYKITHKLLRGFFEKNYTHGFACGKLAGEWLFNKKDFEVINNGINIDQYTFNLETRNHYKEIYRLKDKKVVGHVGHFNFQKNHDYLIDIFYELYLQDKSYRLILIGDGELKEDIESKVKQLGLSNVVIFTGKTLDTPNLMQAMDIIIMPSRFEGLPLTLVEAQCAGLTCFVSSAVSKEAKLTNLVNFINLEKSAKEWADIIFKKTLINRVDNKEKTYNDIKTAGYSIYDNAIRMKELYKRYMK